MTTKNTKRWRRRVLVVISAALIASCQTGASCGGCAPTGYSYPSRVAQGSEPVDEGLRARLTERGLDFIVGHLDTILAQAFPPLSSDPSSPDSRRAAIPFSQFGSMGWGDSGTFGGLFDWNASLNFTDADPPSYAYILLEDADGETLRDKITADFIEPAAIRLHIQDLRIGIQATAVGAADMKFSTEELSLAACLANGADAITCGVCYGTTPSWPDDNALLCSGVALLGGPAGLPADCCKDKDKLTNVDIACDMIDGNAAASPYPGYALSVSLDVIIRPAVSNQGCQGGAASCLRIDSVFDPLTDVSIDDFNIDVVNSGYGDLCSDDDQIIGSLVSLPGTAECDAVCPVLDGFFDVIENVSDLLGPIVNVAAGAIVNGLLDSMLVNLDGMSLESADTIAFADIAPGQVESLEEANDLGYLVRPSAGTFAVNCPAGSNACDERRGMDMILSSGFEAVHDPSGGKPAPNPCVPLVEGRDFVRLYGAPAFEAPTALPLSGEWLEPSSGAPQVYDIAGSVALAAFNQAGFAAYNSGLLCLELGAEEIHALTGGAFALTAGMLDLLAGGDLGQFIDPRAPALIAIAPSEPPVFSMGAGVDGDPLLHLQINGLHVSLYALMYERMVRIFEVVADVNAGLSIIVDPTTRELHVAVSEGPTVDNFVTTYNELLPYTNFSELLPTLIDLALGGMLADNIQFSYDVTPLLSQMLGVPLALSVDGIETIDDGSGERQFLNVYLSLADAASGAGGPLGYHVASDLQVAEPAGLLRRGEQGELHATGQVRLEGGLVPLDGSEEFAYRIDGGAWRSFVQPNDQGLLTLSSPLLALQGHHRVELRGRRVGAYETLEPVPQILRVTLDPEAPVLDLRRNETGNVIALARDLVSDEAHLLYSFALDDQGFGDFSPRAQVDADTLDAVRVVSARAMDEAGNVSPIARLRLRQGPAPVNGIQPGCACASATHTSRGLGLLMLLALAVLIRRRQS